VLTLWYLGCVKYPISRTGIQKKSNFPFISFASRQNERRKIFKNLE